MAARTTGLQSLNIAVQILKLLMKQRDWGVFWALCKTWNCRFCTASVAVPILRRGHVGVFPEGPVEGTQGPVADIQ